MEYTEQQPGACNYDCSNCAANCGERANPDSFLKPLHDGSRVKKVIAVMSGKGGVGKSMVTAQLAVLLQRKGFKTAILDADITGPSIPKLFGLKEKARGAADGILPVMTSSRIPVMSVNLLLPNETDPVVWRGPIIAGTIEQFWSQVLWDDVDFMFVDMPPGTGDVALTVFQSLPVDGVIVVTSPQELVSMVVEKAIKMTAMMDIPVLGIVENMSYLSCPDCGKQIKVFGESHVDEVAKTYGLPVLARVPLDPAIAAHTDKGEIEKADGLPLRAAAEKVEGLLKDQ